MATERLTIDGQIDVKALEGVRADKPEAFFLQRYNAAYQAEIAHFFECLQSGTPFRTTIADGVKAQILADAAAQSCASGQPVKL